MQILAHSLPGVNTTLSLVQSAEKLQRQHCGAKPPGEKLCVAGLVVTRSGLVVTRSAAQAPRHLREDLLSTAAGYPAAEAAVRAAFPVGVLDPARLRQAGAPYLLDPMRACPGPYSVCLAQVAVVAAYVELVGAYFCARTADHVRLVALHLPLVSCMRRFFPDLAKPSPVRAPVPSVVPLALAPADHEDEPWLRVDPRPTPPPSFPALALPLHACSSDDASMGACCCGHLLCALGARARFF